MRTTIDGAGRVVIPKAIRAAMGLRPGQEIDVAFTDGRIEIEVAPLDARVEVARGGWPVLVADNEVPPLDADVVRATLESTRR
jgi:AbrB family looped-hinge helix DNA binding protein